jgi:hypothetical protein
MVISSDVIKARQAVEKAKQVLKAAEKRFDSECGPDNTSLLISEIKSAERRLAHARAELERLQSGGGEGGGQVRPVPYSSDGTIREERTYGENPARRPS